LLNAVKQNYALIFSKAFRIFLIADGKTRYGYPVFKIESFFDKNRIARKKKYFKSQLFLSVPIEVLLAAMRFPYR